MNSRPCLGRSPTRTRSSVLLSILFVWLFVVGLASAPLHGSIPRDRPPAVVSLALIEGTPAAEWAASAFSPARLELGISEGDAGVLRRVLVRQNPWSKFDPEGLSAWSNIWKGDFDSAETTWGGVVGQVVVGIIPIVGQVADARDTIANIGKVWNKPKSLGAWGGLGASIVGWVPLLGDGVKGLAKVGNKVAGEGAQAVAKHADEAASAVADATQKTAREQAAHNAPPSGGSGALTKPPDGLCFVEGTVVAGGIGDRRIEDLRVGDRVLTNDTGAQDSSTVVDPGTWRLVQLHLPNPDGSGDELRFEVLRSPVWMEAVGAKPGAAIWFELAEMGVEGLATVDAVKPCPPIAHGPGRVVLATMTHLNGFVRRLHFAGTDETLLPTATHRFYSEDRQAWVPAGELRAGETLRTQGGRKRLAQIERVPGVHRVFNIEVETEHCYFVGPQWVLSHNAEACAMPGGDKPRKKPPTAAEKPTPGDKLESIEEAQIQKSKSERGKYRNNEEWDGAQRPKLRPIERIRRAEQQAQHNDYD